MTNERAAFREYTFFHGFLRLLTHSTLRHGVNTAAAKIIAAANGKSFFNLLNNADFFKIF